MSEGRRYRIQEVLGRGAFGVVYRAELLSAGGFAKPVALKILRYAADPSAEIEERLRDEARLLGLLRHPSVVHVDGLTRLPDGWAVVMEYIPGVDSGVLIRMGRLPPRVAVTIAEQVAGALYAAWDLPSAVTGQPLRLVHRDLKPGNLRLTGHGEVKILDFGAARADFGSREASTEGWRFGTPRYMAPERHDGIEGPEGDIYALGLVLAQLLTGEKAIDPPTNPERHHEFAAGVVEGVLASLELQLSARNEPTVKALLGVLKEMLSYEPAERPTARQVQQRLRAIQEALPGQDLRSWAEAEIPSIMARQPPLTGDARCGEVIEEGSGEATIELASKSVVPLPATAPLPTAGATPLRSLGLGVAVGLLAVLLLGLLLPWRRPAGPSTTEAEDVRFSVALPLFDQPPEAPPSNLDVRPAPTPSPELTEEPPAAIAADPPEAAPPETPEDPPPAPPPVEVAPAAPPEVKASPPPAGMARFAVTDALGAWADADGESWLPGELPAGTYTLRVRFAEGEDPVPALTFVVAAGDTATIACNAAFKRCRKVSP